MGDLQCPQCLAKYPNLDLLASHMERDDNISPEWITQWVSIFADQKRKSESPSPSPFNSSTDTDTDTTEIDLAVARFRVWFVLDGVTIHRREIPGNEKFEGFCSQLESLYYKPGSKFDVSQFEYVLVRKKRGQSVKAEPFTGSRSYLRMRNKLLEDKSPWRHATVRRIMTVSGLPHSLLFYLCEADNLRKGSFSSGVVRENASNGQFLPATCSKTTTVSSSCKSSPDTLITPNPDSFSFASWFINAPSTNNSYATSAVTF